jgi:hypothetical protein
VPTAAAGDVNVNGLFSYWLLLVLSPTCCSPLPVAAAPVSGTAVTHSRHLTHVQGNEVRAWAANVQLAAILVQGCHHPNLLPQNDHDGCIRLIGVTLNVGVL